MPKGTMREQSAYSLPEEVLFPARLLKVEERTVEFTYKSGPKAGKPGSFTKWEWEFQITDGEYAPLKAFGSTQAEINTLEESPGKDALARPWIEALLGRQLVVGEDVDTDDLIGLTCQVTVRHDDPRPKKDGGMFYPCPVEDVFPPKGSGGNGGWESEPPF